MGRFVDRRPKPGMESNSPREAEHPRQSQQELNH